MLQFTFSQLETWLALFMWPFARISGLLMTAPVLSHSSIPMPVKIGLGVMLTVILSQSLPALPAVSMLSWESLGIIIEQILIGATIGMVMQVVFSVVQASGDFIGMQMGLAFASFFAADMDSNTMILSRFLYIVALLFFISMDGHLMLIQVLVESFRILPIASFSVNANGFMALVRFGGVIFSMGLLMALPVIGVLLVINLSMGILNRSAPQFTVFSVGFPISLLAGMLLFTLLLSHLAPWLTMLFEQGLMFTRTLLQDSLAA